MGRQARSGRKRQYMHFGLEERNNLERRSREVDTAGIQYIEECRMKQVNSEPGEPDCDPCLTDHVICYQASVEWGCFKGFIRTTVNQQILACYYIWRIWRIACFR